MTQRWPQLTPAQDREAYLRGVALWNDGQYRDAHEAWEMAWRSATGDKRLFYQGLIQFAVGLFKLQRGRPSATRKLFAMAREKWGGLPATFLGLDCKQFLEKVDAFTAALPVGESPEPSGLTGDWQSFFQMALGPHEEPEDKSC